MDLIGWNLKFLILMNVILNFNLDLQPFLYSGTPNVIEEFFAFNYQLIGNYFNIAKYCVLSYIKNNIEIDLQIKIPTVVTSINTLTCEISNSTLNSEYKLVYLRLLNDKDQVSSKYVQINVIKPLGPISLVITSGDSNEAMVPLSSDYFAAFDLKCSIGGVIYLFY
jgi:hypothetical protein